jgi:hypothetical protein
MNFGSRIGALTVGGAVLLFAVPAVAQSRLQAAGGVSESSGVADGAFAGFTRGLPLPPQGEPSLPPGSVAPMSSGKPPEVASPAGKPLVADTHVASTELGFRQGVAPAPGHAIIFHGQKFRVIDVEASGGGPTFAGGSPFVIGESGSRLMVGLKSMVPGSVLDPDRFEATAVD